MFTKSATYYDAIYSFKDYEQESRRVHELILRHQRTPGHDLLDVACGTGAHIAYLQQHYTVEGLDVDDGMLAEARHRHPHVLFHLADMVDFDLGRQFDVVVCLFSSIGYVKTEDRLKQAVLAMARHLRPSGLLLVEPWLTPETYKPGGVHGLFVDQPELKIARMNVSKLEGDLSVIEFHYLVGTPQGIENFTERHELGLFTTEQYLGAFREAGLEVLYDAEGLMGRGLLIGIGPQTRAAPQ